MYDNIIKAYELEAIKDKIESIESVVNKKETLIYITLIREKINCPFCLSNNINVKEYVKKKITHSISVTRKFYIIFKRRRFICKMCNKTFYEPDPFTSTNNRISMLTVMNILSYLKAINNTFNDTALMFNVSNKTVMNIFDKHVHPRRKQLPKVLCIDEVHIKSRIKYPYACVLLDFEKNEIVDFLKTRHKNYLLNYFKNIRSEELERVEVVIMDMWATYKDVATEMFPNAIIVIDAFHVVQMINKILDKKRIQVMNKYKSIEQDKLNYTNDYYYLLKTFSWMILSNPRNIKGKYYWIRKYGFSVYSTELLEHLLKSDPELREVYKLRDEYSNFNKTTNSENAKERLMTLIKDFSNHHIEEIREYSYTLYRWRKEIINSFTNKEGFRYSNGKLESRNRQIKTIIKNSMGYKNFYRLRARVMYSINKDVPLKF